MDQQIDERQEYLRRREELTKMRELSIQSFDRTALALSTGGLALSVTFLEKIGSPFSFTSFVLITLYWCSSLVVVTATLFSFHFAEKNMTNKVLDLDDRFTKGELLVEPEKTFGERRLTEICNRTAKVAFALGILLFLTYIFFVQRNNYHKFSLEQEAKMAEKNVANSLQKGLTEVPPARHFRMDGLTEMEMAVSRPGITRGFTETPMAVAKPVNSTQEQVQVGTATDNNNQGSNVTSK